MEIKNALLIIALAISTFLAGFIAGTSRQSEPVKQELVESVMNGVKFQTECFSMISDASDKSVEKLTQIEDKLAVLGELQKQNAELRIQAEVNQKKLLKTCRSKH